MFLFLRGGLLSVLMASAVSVSAWAGLNERSSVAAYRSMVSGEELEFSCNYSAKHLSAGGWIVGGGLSYHPTGVTMPGGHDCYQLNDAGTSLYEGYVEKYTEAGVLDTTFGTDTDGDGTHEGRVRVAVKNAATERGGMDVRVAVQSDGDIVAAWTVFPVSGESFVRVARYSGDGVLDASSVADLTVKRSDLELAPIRLRDIALLSSGKLAVLVRADGAPDNFVGLSFASLQVYDLDNREVVGSANMTFSHWVLPESLLVSQNDNILVTGSVAEGAFIAIFDGAAVSGGLAYLEPNGSGEWRSFRSMAVLDSGLYLLRSTYGADGKWRCGIVALPSPGAAGNDGTFPDGSDFETDNATDSNYCTGFAPVTAGSATNWVVAGSHNGKSALFLLDSLGKLKKSGNSNFPSGVWVSASANSSGAYQVLVEADNKLLIGGFSGSNRLWTFLDFSAGDTTGGAGLFLLPFLMLVFRRRY